MTSIRYSDTVTGAILSLHGINTASLQTSATRKELLHSGFMATSSFSDISTRNRDMLDMLVNARSYALSDSPVLICGTNGDEGYAIAEAIHNSSARRGGPFVTVNLLGIDQEDQELVLFGRRERTEHSDRSRGALSRADHGTLLIIGIRKLKPSVQMLLSKTMMHGNILRTDTQSLQTLDARIICLSSCDLREEVNSGTFLPTLYYQLQGLTLKIPPLHERPEDLADVFDEEFTKAVRTYKRPLKLTDGGRKKILSLQWDGGRVQLHAFTERLVLCAKKRSIDEIYIQKTYDELYPSIRKIEGENRLVVYETPEALELKNILQKNGGNRAQTAEELGISTTTLWRKMKKFGIEASFES
jgi:DNA-binding NtrC family response regulator